MCAVQALRPCRDEKAMLQMWEDNILTHYDMSKLTCCHCNKTGDVAAEVFGAILIGIKCLNCEKYLRYDHVGVPKDALLITPGDPIE